MTDTTILIPHRFRGPAESGNGGYTCGAIAAAVGVPVEVTLRSPPPLETPMELVVEGEGWHVVDGETLVATAVPAIEPPQPPPAPTVEQAEAAQQRYLGLESHDFPSCFTCGTGRDDALAIFTGPVDGMEVVAALWTPDSSLPNEAGAITVPIAWAALDCPGAWATIRTDGAPAVLGRMAAHIERTPLIGETLIAYGWNLGTEGRKAWAGTALAQGDGTPIAWAAQTWIAL